MGEAMTLDPSCRHEWTWGEWVAYIERLQREFEALYPPSECVVFPEEGA